MLTKTDIKLQIPFLSQTHLSHHSDHRNKLARLSHTFSIEF
jgi:hypothetical protein